MLLVHRTILAILVVSASGCGAVLDGILTDAKPIAKKETTATAGDVARLVWSIPSCGSSLFRTSNNTILLDFDREIPMPEQGELQIRAIDEDGALVGEDKFQQLQRTLINGTRLTLLDPGNAKRSELPPPVLENLSWISIQNDGNWSSVAPFSLVVRVVNGDVSDDGVATFGDISFVVGHDSFGSSGELLPTDVNGDGSSNWSELSAIFAVTDEGPAPPRPPGHECTAQLGFAEVISTMPCCGGSLPKISGNEIRIEFDRPVRIPDPGELIIQVIDEDGTLIGDDLYALAVVPSVESETTLVLRENGRHNNWALPQGFENQTWLAIYNDGSWPGVTPFEITLAVLVGDVTSGRSVDMGDLSRAFAYIQGSSHETRVDTNDDGLLGFGDLSMIWDHAGVFVRLPTNHECPTAFPCPDLAP